MQCYPVINQLKYSLIHKIWKAGKANRNKYKPLLFPYSLNIHHIVLITIPSHHKILTDDETLIQASLTKQQ